MGIDVRKMTLPERIDAALNGRPMKYYDLARILYPDGRSWQYQSNGGPPGCFMALSAGLRRGGFPPVVGITSQATVYPRDRTVREESKIATIA